MLLDQIYVQLLTKSTHDQKFTAALPFTEIFLDVGWKFHWHPGMAGMSSITINMDYCRCSSLQRWMAEEIASVE